MYVLIIILILLLSAVTLTKNGSGNTNNKRFLIVRHSERLDSVSDAKIKPWYDTPITDNMFYINRFYKHYKNIITDFKYIYCSPFTRCIQTAILIINKLPKKIPICLEPGLIEITSIKPYLNNDYFLPENIYNKFGKGYFNTNYTPVLNSEKIKKYLTKEYTYEVVLKKLKSLIKKLDSGILVTHREIVSVTDSVNDDYCGSGLVELNNNKIILLDSF